MKDVKPSRMKLYEVCHARLPAGEAGERGNDKLAHCSAIDLESGKL